MSDRTVHTDALATLGTIIGPNEKRDAVHIAVMPVEAAKPIVPGQQIGINGDGKADYVGVKYIGIADPYLTGGIDAGQHFWLMLFPRMITSLRHVWSHPDIPDSDDIAADREESKRYLELYAIRLFGGDPYDGEETSKTALDVLLENAESGSFCTEIEGPGRTPDEEFWKHFERYTGRKVAQKPNYFFCGC